MNITSELVNRYKVSKYQIAKKVGVSWNTVSFWYKGVFKPKDIHNVILEEMLNANKGKEQ